MLLTNKLYENLIAFVATKNLPWEKLKNKKLLISGGSGTIGLFLIHVLMYKNDRDGINTTVVALSRNKNRLEQRFQEYQNHKNLVLLSQDINVPLPDIGKIDYIIHAASNTHPVAYATDPIGTITTNIAGTFNMLSYAAEYKAERFLFASSVEVYGENRGDIDYFDEEYCGYINCNTLRAGYPESKRAGEALCQAFIKQKSVDAVIARFSRTYGPTMLLSDTKAIAQFIKNGINKEDIILKSEGNQYYSYNYIADTVTGLLTILLNGKLGEAYNVADNGSNISLKNLASLIAEICNTNVVFQLPEMTESAGYSKATKAVMDSQKLQHLGWKAEWDIKKGIFDTIQILNKEKEALRISTLKI